MNDSNDWLFSFLQQLNYTSSLIIGFFLIGLFFYLLKFKTCVQLKPYATILMYSVISDGFYLLTTWFTQMRIKFVNPTIIAFFMGPIVLVKPQYQILVVGIWSTSLTLGFLTLFLMHYFRYFSIKNGCHPNSRQTVTCCLVVFLLAVGNFLMCVGPQFKFMFSSEIKETAFSNEKSSTAIWFITYVCAVVLFCYFGSLFLATRTIRLTKTHSVLLSTRTVKMQNELGRALFIQRLIPLLSIGPSLLVHFFVFLNLNVQPFFELAMLLISWYPVLNVMTILYTVKTYRQFISQKLSNLFCRNREHVVDISVHQSTTHNTLLFHIA
ncbi:hypothetical protein M3Y95_00904000 [Aphelenchoides besseyi]|nr:hypothetical protein M3Y95_00904000 [Aphelenchoides besseyi]